MVRDDAVGHRAWVEFTAAVAGARKREFTLRCAQCGTHVGSVFVTPVGRMVIAPFPLKAFLFDLARQSIGPFSRRESDVGHRIWLVTADRRVVQLFEKGELAPGRRDVLTVGGAAADLELFCKKGHGRLHCTAVRLLDHIRVAERAGRTPPKLAI